MPKGCTLSREAPGRRRLTPYNIKLVWVLGSRLAAIIPERVVATKRVAPHSDTHYKAASSSLVYC